MNKSNNSPAPKRPNKLRRRLEVLLIIAAILILTLTACAPALSPIPVETFIPSAVAPTSTSTEIPATATATLTIAQEPPPCTFPLAQITTVESAPENYTFSAPKVVLTAPKKDYYHIYQWLPDNQQLLITEDLLSNYVFQSNTVAQQSISLLNAVTGTSKVYAIRPGSYEPPAWNPALNAVIYSAKNYTSVDNIHGTYTFTRQVLVSHGDPNATQKLSDNLSDNLSDFPFGFKPDGSKMIYRSDNEINGWDKSLKSIPSVSFDPTQWDYAKERRNSEPVSFQMAWQPGSSQVFLYSDGVVGRGGYTFILNTDTGQVCELSLGGWAGYAHWSSDGRYLAFIRSTNYSVPTFSADPTVLDTVTGNLKVLSFMPQKTYEVHLAYDSSWAPDNRHLAVVGSIYTSPDTPDQTGLYLVDLVSGQGIKVDSTYSYATEVNSIVWSIDGSKVAVLCHTPGVGGICLITVQKSGQ